MLDPNSLSARPTIQEATSPTNGIANQLSAASILSEGQAQPPASPYFPEAKLVDPAKIRQALGSPSRIELDSQSQDSVRVVPTPRREEAPLKHDFGATARHLASTVETRRRGA